VRTRRAVATSVAFFLAAPVMVAGVVPWWLSQWHPAGPLARRWPLRTVGALLVVCATSVLVVAFVRFVVEGRGSPAPVAPTDQLVIGGLYRYVRNPMYLAVVTIIAGQALLIGSAAVAVYGAVVWAAMAAFARWYEEAALTRRYGATYERYRQAVPAWRPRPLTRASRGGQAQAP
jgi:protein-S-isoprenylcysteine O-methyltransferase Ste14